MDLAPNDVNQLGAQLARACRDRAVIGAIDLSRMNRVLAHTSDDLTATVETGMPFARFQEHLARHRQWLPIDPPDAGHLTIGDLLDRDLNGPRRFGFGTARDYLIGVRVVLGDGRIIRAGGKVVKNVAGFDLCKLFVGNRGSLGVVTEATFKLLPLPEREASMERRVDSVDEGMRAIDAILYSPLRPVVLDWVREAPEGGDGSNPTGGTRVVLGFSGTDRDVTWQCERAEGMGFRSRPADFAYDPAIRLPETGADLTCTSVLPSRVGDAIRELGTHDVFVARAGNGILYDRRQPPRPPDHPPATQWMDRLKAIYDPGGVLPGGS